nr:CTP synthase-like [Ipomoea batatas]
MPFIEALRQLFFTVGQDNFCLIHVSLIPVLGVVGEQKTKPTQHSVRELRALGLTPHFLACRSAQPLLENTKQKLSQFCHVPVSFKLIGLTFQPCV